MEPLSTQAYAMQDFYFTNENIRLRQMRRALMSHSYQTEQWDRLPGYSRAVFLIRAVLTRSVPC